MSNQQAKYSPLSVISGGPIWAPLVFHHVFTSLHFIFIFTWPYASHFVVVFDQRKFKISLRHLLSLVTPKRGSQFVLFISVFYIFISFRHFFTYVEINRHLIISSLQLNHCVYCSTYLGSLNLVKLTKFTYLLVIAKIYAKSYRNITLSKRLSTTEFPKQIGQDRYVGNTYILIRLYNCLEIDIHTMVIGLMLRFNEPNADFQSLVAGQVLLQYVGRDEFHYLLPSALRSSIHGSGLRAKLVRMLKLLPLVYANGKLRRKPPINFDYANSIKRKQIFMQLIGNRWCSTFILKRLIQKSQIERYKFPSYFADQNLNFNRQIR